MNNSLNKCHGKSWYCIAFFVLLFYTLFARDAHALPGKDNQTVAEPTITAIPVAFSENPGDAEFFACRLFPERLLPMGGRTSPEENRALADAIITFAQNPSPDETGPLTNFLNKYPESPWRVSVLANLGSIYRRGGYWTSAFDAWRKAWSLGKDETEPANKMLVDYALAHASDMALNMSWVDYLEVLQKESEGRDVRGVATELLPKARAGLYQEKTDFAAVSRCGPLAVRKLIGLTDRKKAVSKSLHEPAPTDVGTTLTQLKKFASENNLHYQLAYRSPGAAMIVPCVVNWKMGHHSAITKAINSSYLVDDDTLTEKYLVGTKAIDQEASGYFLVPKGNLPPGWKSVSEKEGSKIWGKCLAPNTTNSKPPKDDPCKKKNGMVGYSIDKARVSVMLADIPLYYYPPYGPAIELKVNYNQRDAGASSLPNYPNLGSKWNIGWVCFVVEDKTTHQNTKIYGPSGGELDYLNYNSSTNQYALEPDRQSTLTSTSETTYRTFPDGSRQVFGLADNSSPQRFYMTESYDPVGNKITYNYEVVNGVQTYRLISIADALGQITTLSYASNNSGDPSYWKISQVTDPFGRTATFEYYPDGNPSAGLLWKITDMGGITSQISYQGATDIASKLTTPYGDTTFVYEDYGNHDRSLLVTNPEQQTEAVMFKYDQAPPDANAPIPSGNYDTLLEYRTTYYWNHAAYAQSAKNNGIPTDYSKAYLAHWLHLDSSTVDDVPASTKNPLENRVFYNYPGQYDVNWLGTLDRPSVVARLMDDGSTQAFCYEYNSLGNTTKMVTPGDANTPSRTTRFVYAANGMDVLNVYQDNPNGQSTITVSGSQVRVDLLKTYTYDSGGQHLVTSVTDASGQTTSFGYNSVGQLLSSTNARMETTTCVYDHQGQNGETYGYLLSVTGAAPGATASFTYDDYSRVKTVTDSTGYTVQKEYDLLDHPTKITYPDGTTTEIAYNALDPAWSKDRLGRWTGYAYNGNRQLAMVVDPLNRSTQYDWCACGSLDSITDPAGNTTTFLRDAQGRVTTKVFPDTTTLSYAYEAGSGRLQSTLDAKGQRTNFQYYIDNSLKQVSYTDVSGGALNPATPSVSFTRDSIYPRVTAMADATGTTQYAYNPVTGALGSGLLATVTGPWANTIAYSYDELGRVRTRTISGTANTVTSDYDTLGRVVGVTNPLGAFGYTYVGTTARTGTMTYPNGQSTTFGYFNNVGDQRLQEIKNMNASGGVISQFDYTYNVVGDILTWTQANSGQTNAQQYAFGYDDADQLTGAQIKDTATQALLKDLAYGYDMAGNRTSAQEASVVSSGTANAVNQVLQTSGGGMMRFAGTVSKPSTVTVGGNMALVRADNSFEGYAAVSSDSTTRVHIVATDTTPNRNTTDNHVDVPPSSVPAQAYVYDLNGNMTAAGPAGAPDVTYGWDAANRLTSIAKSGTTTVFDYDGLGRRVREWTNGTETKRWVWDGLELCEERDSNNAVTKRYYAQGMQVVSGSNSGSYYYTRDHLGSVREMTSGTGAIRARYDYDPYGKRSKVSGDMEADFGFTGHYQHAASGLTLAPYRAYDADLGRWISRDPLDNAEMRQGPNLYAYVKNDPTNEIDPLGLWGAGGYVGGTAYAGVGAVGAGATGNAGGGYFSGTGMGGFASGGAFAGTPGGTGGDFAAGAYAGVGGGGYLTSASKPCDLKAMKSYSLDIGVGPFKVSIDLGIGGGNWMVGASFGPGIGLGVSGMNTTTVTTH